MRSLGEIDDDVGAGASALGQPPEPERVNEREAD